MCINKICEKMKVSNIGCSVISYILIVVVSVGIIGFYVNDMKNQQKTFFHKYETILNTIQTNQAKINNPKNKKPEIISFEKESYQDFLARNYEIQSGWLNAWIMFLGILVAVMGIAFPIFAMDKKKEIDDIIEKSKQKVNDAVANADESKKQANEAIIQANVALDQVKDAVTKVTKLVDRAKASEEHAKESEDMAQASAYFAMGHQSYKEKQFKMAIDYYDKSIALNSNNAAAYYNRGIAKSALGQKEEAIEDYTEAIRIKPDIAEAYYNRGIAKFALGQKEEAIKDFTDAIKLKPDLAEAYNNRGAAKFDLGQKEEAIKDFTDAIRLNFDNVRAYYNLSEAYIFNEQFAKSLETLNLYVQKMPDAYIFNDDNDQWLNILNNHLENSDVQQIIEIMNRLKKKDR